MSTTTRVHIKIKEDYNREETVQEFINSMFVDSEDPDITKAGDVDWLNIEDNEVTFEVRGFLNPTPWITESKLFPSINLTICAENYDYDSFIVYSVKNGEYDQEEHSKYAFLRKFSGYENRDLLEEFFEDFETKEDYSLHILGCEKEDKHILERLVRKYINVPRWEIKRRYLRGYGNRKDKGKKLTMKDIIKIIEGVS